MTHATSNIVLLSARYCRRRNIISPALKMKTSIVLIASSLASASAFAGLQLTTTSSSTSLSATRRDTLSQFGTSAAAVLLSGVSSAQASDKEEYSELINVLKARSEDNKEANANYAVRANKMSSKDFKDAKSRRPKLM